MREIGYFDCGFDRLSFDLGEALRLMGYGDYAPSDYVRSLIDKILDDLRSVVKPHFGYVLLDGYVKGNDRVVVGDVELAPGRIITHAMKGADCYALFTATIGGGFDEYCKNYKEAGDMVGALIADTLGSVLAEAVVAVLVDTLSKNVEGRGWRISNNYSPGYCDWPLSDQKRLFSLLPADGRTGISLTGSCLMLPVKSVSGIIAVGASVKKLPYGCAICKMTSCIKNQKNRKLHKT